MSNKQAIEILDEMMEELEIKRWNEKKYDKEKIDCAQHYIRLSKSHIQSLTDTDEWISADNPPEEVQMKQILAYEIDERRWIITATFYDGKWLRDDNENICFFDFWKPLPTPPISK